MRKILNLILISFVFVFSGFIFTGCDDDIILVTGVDLYTNEIYADLNETIDLSYKVYPSNASNKKVTFWSTDENIASVDENGKVTLKSQGEASIVVRSVDGGYEDYCKIITNIDPEEIRWDTSDKLVETNGANYSATSSMALNQVMKLKVEYLIDGEVSDVVTNKSVTFSSSNSSNIKVINEKEGIIKAVNNEIISGDKAFSDITATLKTTAGELSITCRVFINEYSSKDHLFVNYKLGNNAVLNERNGSEIIYLTSGGNEVEFYSYITNMSDVVKTDYEMSLISSNDDLFSVINQSYENGVFKFTLKPSLDNEGAGTLYIRTTCSDESGKTIRCNVNVIVQAEIDSVIATATKRRAENADPSKPEEILINGEIFSIDLTYLDSNSHVIDGAVRNIYFDALPTKTALYVTDYGNNQFKVIRVPDNPYEEFVLTGYIYVENVESSAKIPFEYKFYLRNSLESLIVSESPKQGSIPTIGIGSITIPVGGSASLYAYATTYDFSLTEPTNVVAEVSNSSLLQLTQNTNPFVIKSKGAEGITNIKFIATDGLTTIEYNVTVYIVASVANINFFSTNSAGLLTEKIESESYTVTGDSARIYVQLEASSEGYIIECESGVSLTATNATLGEIVYPSSLKVIKYFDVDLSGLVTGGTISITIKADRFLASKTIRIVKG